MPAIACDGCRKWLSVKRAHPRLTPLLLSALPRSSQLNTTDWRQGNCAALNVQATIPIVLHILHTKDCSDILTSWETNRPEPSPTLAEPCYPFKVLLHFKGIHKPRPSLLLQEDHIQLQVCSTLLLRCWTRKAGCKRWWRGSPTATNMQSISILITVNTFISARPQGKPQFSVNVHSYLLLRQQIQVYHILASRLQKNFSIGVKSVRRIINVDHCNIEL